LLLYGPGGGEVNSATEDESGGKYSAGRSAISA
jgi:hypothetical protein